MLKFGNKEFRNLQEQVLKNMQNIASIKEGTAVLSEFGIKVVGEVDSLQDLPSVAEYKSAHDDWEYGDAFAIGTEPPYTLVILTRANDEITADHWFDIGDFPAPGPQGATGPQGEVGPQGPQGNTGEAGADAGFGSILATAQTLPAGSSATATVTASGPNTAKEFSFTFGIPRGQDGSGKEEVTFIDYGDTTIDVPALLEDIQEGKVVIAKIEDDIESAIGYAGQYFYLCDIFKNSNPLRIDLSFISEYTNSIGTEAYLEQTVLHYANSTVSWDEPVVINITPTEGVESITVNSINYTPVDGVVTLPNYPKSINWGNLKGTLSNQTDLQTALNAKQDVIDSSHKLSASLVDGLSTVATTGDYDDLTNKPTLFDGDYNSLTNKPDLSIYETKSEAFSGDYNDLTNKPTIPTKTSDLTNDSGFITSSSLSGYATESWVTNQGYLTTVSWSGVTDKPTFATVATTGSYSDLSGTPDLSIYATISSLGDCAYLNESSLSVTASQVSGLATVATTGSYSDLSGTPSIPTNTSDLNNDSGFITSSSLSGYATETWVENKGYLTTVSWSDISDKPTFAAVAITGYYNDLIGTPTIPDAVSGTNDGTNWTSLTIGASTYSIPQGGSGTVTDVTVCGVSTLSGTTANILNEVTLSSSSGLLSDDSVMLNPQNTIFVHDGDRYYYTDYVAATGTYYFARPLNILSNSGKWYNQYMKLHKYDNEDHFRYTFEIRYVNEVEGTNDGTNWTSLKIGLNTYSIPSSTASIAWGSITGTLSSQTDLQNALDAKATTSSLATVATTGSYSDLTGTPDLSIYATVSSLATVATTGSYSDLTDTPTIPTLTSQLTNDSGFITSITSSMVTSALGYTPGTSNFSGSYDDLTDKPTIPTDTSDLTNGAGFITSSSLSGYATETWVGQQGYQTASDVTTTLSAYSTTSEMTTAISTAVSSKLDATMCTYQTTEPTAAIADGGVHIVYLSAEPTTKYSGYIYMIAEA